MNTTITIENTSAQFRIVTISPKPTGGSAIVGKVARMHNGLFFHGNSNRTARKNEQAIREYMAAQGIKVLSI